MPKTNNSNIIWHQPTISKKERAKLFGHSSVALWFTGLSGSGKSTLAHAVENRLYKRSCHSFVLDGDNIRHGLNMDLGFSREDRQENIRRIAELVHIFVDAGLIVLAALISPYRADRQKARGLLESNEFIEIFCRCELNECEKRDPKGLYKKARAGKIPEFTGISSPYEEPDRPEIVVNTDRDTIDVCVDKIISYLERNNYLK